MTSGHLGYVAHPHASAIPKLCDLAALGLAKQRQPHALQAEPNTILSLNTKSLPMELEGASGGKLHGSATHLSQNDWPAEKQELPLVQGTDRAEYSRPRSRFPPSQWENYRLVKTKERSIKIAQSRDKQHQRPPHEDSSEEDTQEDSNWQASQWKTNNTRGKSKTSGHSQEDTVTIKRFFNDIPKEKSKKADLFSITMVFQPRSTTQDNPFNQPSKVVEGLLLGHSGPKPIHHRTNCPT